MKKLILKIFVIISMLAFAEASLAYFNPGRPAGFVNDYTGTLSPEQKQRLEDKLTRFEKDTSNEIAVAMIKSLQGDTVENFAEKLFKDWGIGKKGKDNGVLLLIAKDDRQMRIEVGYGLEGALTDAQSYWIVDRVMKPAFQADDFYKGINEATDKVMAATKGEYVPSEGKNPLPGFDWPHLGSIIVFAFMWLSAILGRSRSWWLGGVLGLVIGIIVGIMKGFVFLGFTAMAILFPLGLLFDYIVSKQYNAGRSRGSVPWWVGGGRWGGGGGGGFGGFGGGRSGGGGSSGGW